jgi:hypothetical protein
VAGGAELALLGTCEVEGKLFSSTGEDGTPTVPTVGIAGLVAVAIALAGFIATLVESLTSWDVVLLLVVSTFSAVELPELFLA